MWLSFVLVVIFIVCVGFLYAGGLWNNAVTLLNVVLAALLATNYWEPLADWFDSLFHPMTNLADFAALWAIFALSFALMRMLTDVLSKVKVRFKRPIDVAGGILFAAAIAWVLVSFTTMTLHTAPLSQNFLSAFPTPETRTFYGLEPDRAWLGFSQKLSMNTLAGGRTFDPDAAFIFKYGQRRADYEKNLNTLAPK